ncbi:hypothetical protein [Echinicola rosea]|uniref:Uncharacterized protein n=1 Tax=Echinicola rosea TaxID=1807691 RepID=A0ABQ1USG0_9BACT|nr:hypothetical protein [Echinicola rosea]GGF25442.1 hypothetical protein GCM10011339_11920 [Echinicola rosea]
MKAKSFSSSALLLLALAWNACQSSKGTVSWQELAPPETNGAWLQPSANGKAQPIWGHANGLQIGISPMPGPRGLMNVYAPYLGHKTAKMVNFFAMEPIVKGNEQRGFSELEMSSLDGVRGKRFWSANDSLASVPRDETAPASGIIEEVDRIGTLTVFVFSEPFDNGAKVYVRLRFYEDRPYEVEIKTYAVPDSKPLEKFIITATMGNFARLRKLYLKDTVKYSKKIWEGYKDVHFTSHDTTPVDNMLRDSSGNAYFVATPDETEPEEATYTKGTNEHWKYYGKKAVQYWKKPDPSDQLKGLVNGRWAYWASESPIPGGISFENFELNEPFKNGDTFVFGVVPMDDKEAKGNYGLIMNWMK